MKSYTFEIFKTKDLEWEWRMWNPRTRRIIAKSHVGFCSLPECRSNLEQVVGIIPPALMKTQTSAKERYMIGHREFRTYKC